MFTACGVLTPWLSVTVAVRVALPTKLFAGLNTQLPLVNVTVPWLAGTVIFVILKVSPATSLSTANKLAGLIVKLASSFML